MSTAEADPDEAQQDQEDAVDALDQATEIDNREQEWERIGTERLKALGECVKSVGELIYPASPVDAGMPHFREMDEGVKRAFNRTLKTMSKEMNRLCTFCGPRQPSKGA